MLRKESKRTLRHGIAELLADAQLAPLDVPEIINALAVDQVSPDSIRFVEGEASNRSQAKLGGVNEDGKVSAL